MTSPSTPTGAAGQGVEVAVRGGKVAPVGLSFWVDGIARPKGSMRHIGHGRMIEQVDNKDWRRQVTDAAILTTIGRKTPAPSFTGPVAVVIAFSLPRPKTAPTRVWPIKRGLDIDKAARLVLDCLTDALVVADDSQVVDLTASKRYGTPTGAQITVTAVTA